MIPSITFSRIPRALVFGAALTLALPTAARAEPTQAAQQEAEVRFKKALDLFRDGDYQAALIEFRRANELAPNYNVLYNIGQVYFQLQDYPNALHSLQRYLDEGGNRIAARRRGEVERDLDKLRARIASVEIAVSVDDADISVDDVSVGKSPLPKAVVVSAGKHRLAASKANFALATKVIEIAGAENQKVSLDLVENPTTPSTSPEPSKPPPPRGASESEIPRATTMPVVLERQPAPAPPKPVPWAGWAVTAGLTGGAIATGIVAMHASSDLASLRTSGTASRSDLESAQSKTKSFALATDLLVGSAVIAGGFTLGFTIANLRSAKPLSSGSGDPPPVVASVGIVPGGLVVHGMF